MTEKYYFHQLLPSKLKTMMNEVYEIQERTYQYVSPAADVENNIVFIEFVEKYPDPKTGQMYCTPQVAICELENGKIRRTRHYMDPRTSFHTDTETKLPEALS